MQTSRIPILEPVISMVRQIFFSALGFAAGAGAEAGLFAASAPLARRNKIIAAPSVETLNMDLGHERVNVGAVAYCGDGGRTGWTSERSRRPFKISSACCF